MSKRCSKCGAEKPDTEFYKDNRAKLKLTSWCRSCLIVNRSLTHKEAGKKYRENNPDRVRSSAQRHRNKKDGQWNMEK